MKIPSRAITAEASNEAKQKKHAAICQHKVIGHETAAKSIFRQAYCRIDKHPKPFMRPIKSRWIPRGTGR